MREAKAVEQLVLQAVAVQEGKLITVVIQHLVVQGLLTKDMQEQALVADLTPGDLVAVEVLEV